MNNSVPPAWHGKVPSSFVHAPAAPCPYAPHQLSSPLPSPSMPLQKPPCPTVHTPGWGSPPRRRHSPALPPPPPWQLQPRHQICAGSPAARGRQERRQARCTAKMGMGQAAALSMRVHCCEPHTKVHCSKKHNSRQASFSAHLHGAVEVLSVEGLGDGSEDGHLACARRQRSLKPLE